jgi:hypothetical protein
MGGKHYFAGACSRQVSVKYSDKDGEPLDPFYTFYQISLAPGQGIGSVKIIDKTLAFFPQPIK